MIPHPTIPRFYIIPDYISFQSVFFNAYEPIDTNLCQDKVDTTLTQDKHSMLKNEK